VRSLNPRWNLNDFHARIAKLAAIGVGNRVLDLGCGRGNGLPHLLAGIGTSGEVIAADRDSPSLDAVRATYAAEIAKGLLSVVNLDVGRELPLASASFDCVVCQNVIECVADRNGLLSEIYRILRPGGSALIGHHDFDGVLIASDDRDLTRRLVHGYADLTQPWQDLSEGQMGRLLPGLVGRSPFDETETETVLFVELALSKDCYARQHLDDIVGLCRQFGVDEADAKKWLLGLEGRSAAGAFYYALPWTYVIARRRWIQSSGSVDSTF
jgi:SAM-dependent methyltransferase